MSYSKHKSVNFCLAKSLPVFQPKSSVSLIKKDRHATGGVIKTRSVIKFPPGYINDQTLRQIDICVSNAKPSVMPLTGEQKDGGQIQLKAFVAFFRLFKLKFLVFITFFSIIEFFKMFFVYQFFWFSKQIW